MATPIQAAAQRASRLVQLQRANAAARAAAGDIPRPRPVAEAVPAAPSRPAPPAAPAPAPLPQLPPEAVQFLLNKVESSGIDSLTANELAALSRSFEGTAPSPSAIDDVQIEVPDLNGNLAASGIELDATPAGGAANLRPKKAKGPTQLEKLANEINQIAGSVRTGEAIAPRQARSTWGKVNNLTSEEFSELVGVMGNEEAALAKLEQVQNIAGDAARDPNSLAAAAIDRAKQAREGTMRAQGSNAPEFATDNLTDADMPTAADTARAVERERQLELQSRSPGGWLSLEERILLAGLDPSDPQAARKLPLWLKGRDGRPTAMESRSRGSRAVEGNDIKILAPLIKAREKLAAATTPEEQAKALAEVTAAEDALNRKYGTMKRQRGDAFGRPAMPDSRLNKGGQMETFDDLVISIVGARPKAERSLGRSTDAMSAMERRALDQEAVDAFGEDAFEFLPDEQELDDVADLGESGKPRKVRGRPLPSRQQGAMQTMFAGGQNPIAMMGSPEAVADEILSKQTVFRPGTANYEMARERLARAIQNEFGGPGPKPATNDPAAVPGPATAMGTSQDPARIPARQNTWPEGLMRQSATSGPDVGTNVRVESPTGSPVGEFPPIGQQPVTALSVVPQPGGSGLVPQAAPLPGPKPLASDVNLDASDIDILDEADDALNEFDRDMPPGARTPGRGQGGRRKGGGSKRGKGTKEPVIVDAEKVEVVGADPSIATAPDASNPVLALPDRRLDAAKPDASPEPKPDGGGKGPPNDGDKPKLADPDKPIEPDSKKDSQAQPPSRLGRWLKLGGLIGAGVIGGAALRGSGRAGGSEYVPPIPTGASVSGDGGEPTEADLDRILERIRGARSGSAAPSYQTLQNWTVWR